MDRSNSSRSLNGFFNQTNNQSQDSIAASDTTVSFYNLLDNLLDDQTTSIPLVSNQQNLINRLSNSNHLEAINPNVQIPGDQEHRIEFRPNPTQRSTHQPRNPFLGTLNWSNNSNSSSPNLFEDNFLHSSNQVESTRPLMSNRLPEIIIPIWSPNQIFNTEYLNSNTSPHEISGSIGSDIVPSNFAFSPDAILSIDPGHEYELILQKLQDNPQAQFQISYRNSQGIDAGGLMRQAITLAFQTLTKPTQDTATDLFVQEGNFLQLNLDEIKQDMPPGFHQLDEKARNFGLLLGFAARNHTPLLNNIPEHMLDSIYEVYSNLNDDFFEHLKNQGVMRGVIKAALESNDPEDKFKLLFQFKPSLSDQKEHFLNNPDELIDELYTLLASIEIGCGLKQSAPETLKTQSLHHFTQNFFGDKYLKERMLNGFDIRVNDQAQPLNEWLKSALNDWLVRALESMTDEECQSLCQGMTGSNTLRNENNRKHLFFRISPVNQVMTQNVDYFAHTCSSELELNAVKLRELFNQGEEGFAAFRHMLVNLSDSGYNRG